MIIKKAEFITSVASSDKFLQFDKPVIAVCGKSNVGKSSFINMLANRKKLAKTSETPGRTRLINYFDFGEFVLADLPGYGFAKVPQSEKEKWAKLMEEYFQKSENIDHVFMLVDIRHQPTFDDESMFNYLNSYAFSHSIIATKADKLSRMKIKDNVKAIAKYFIISEDAVIATSSETGLGKDEVLSKLDKIIEIYNSDFYNSEEEEDEDDSQN